MLMLRISTRLTLRAQHSPFIRRPWTNSLLPRFSNLLRISTSRPNIPPETHALAPDQIIKPPSSQTEPIDRVQLSKIQAYLALVRFHAPIGTVLLFIPCAQSILLAAYLTSTPPLHTLSLLFLFGTGAFVMRSAGCIINDLWDRDLDKQVARTSTRPLASGALSPTEAITCLAGLLTCGLGVLTQLNTYSILLGASSLGLVVVYPLMKRITYVPQLVLGLAFNWGALLGYPALLPDGACTSLADLLPIVPLYVSGIFWTLIYDTIYAHQDTRDDAKVGIKSTALLIGQDHTKSVLGVFAAAQFAALLYLGTTQGLGAGYACGTGLAALYTARMIALVDVTSPADCGRWFKRSQMVGWLIVAGLAADYTYTQTVASPTHDRAPEKVDRVNASSLAVE